jgi:uncharacterized membrane protein HdeD (DUF308 family)
MEVVRMASNNAAAAPAVPVTAAAPAAPSRGIAFPWWVSLVAGVVTIIIGLLLLAAPAATTAVIVQVLGLYWLIDGVIRLVSLFVNRSGWGLKLCMGVLGIIAGLAVLQHPLWSTFLVPATLVLVLGIIGMIIGMVQIVTAFRGAGWATGLFGLTSVIFGLLIIMNPLQGMVALPFLLGFLAIAVGVVGPIVSIATREGRAHPQAATPVG